MNKIRKYVYVAKCLELGGPRLWAFKKDVIEKGMRDWTSKQVRLKPLALWKYPLVIVDDDYYDVDWGYKNDKGEYVDNGVQVV